MMANWGKSLHKTRYVMDTVLLIFFILANVPQINLPFHEWISLIFIVPFIVHLLLHYDWILQIPARFLQKISGEIRFNFIFDCLMYLLMVFVIVSGILASEVVLPLFMDFQAQPLWADLHHRYSNILMIFVGVHLGMHWRWIVDMTKGLFKTSAKQRPGSQQIESN